MSRWTRVPPGVTVFCGGCDALLPPGAWVWQVTIARVRQPLARCVVCAACASHAPPDLPDVVEAAPPSPSRPPSFVRIGQIRAPLGFDWRARAAGMPAREPGEEG